MKDECVSLNSLQSDIAMQTTYGTLKKIKAHYFNEAFTDNNSCTDDESSDKDEREIKLWNFSDDLIKVRYKQTLGFWIKVAVLN